MRGDHSRQPATNRPITARMSNAEAATCAAGSESHRPPQPKASTAGT